MRVATLKLPPPPSLSTIVIKMIFNEAFLISLISSFSYLYTYFMRWKRCDGDIDSIEYRTTICGARPRIPIERWLIVWAAKKTNTRNGRCVAYTRAMFNK